MSFDNSRIIFNSWNDYLGMITLQGRVQLDSDWNDFQGQFLRRIQAGTLDTIGQAVYPAALPNSFMITAAVNSGVNQILIGAGRMYVDGLLAENHGPMNPGNTPTSIAQWDPVLAELSNTYPGAPYVGVDYMAQPFYPNPSPSVLSGGPYLAYLDVWQREVTYLEDPNLVEKAVGVDTTARLQTVWQVRLLDVSSAATPVTCLTPPASIPGWTAATQSSGGQLTTALVTSTPSGPCTLTPNTGYTGMENQFYRVEIHQPGGFGAAGANGTATFKWSKDNASVMTAVTGINYGATNTAGAATSQLTVQSLGRDQVLGFNKGDWIELIDDYLELNGLPGELHLIDGVTPSANAITLVSPIATPADFPVTSGLTDPTRHTRIRRWDQKGVVYQSDYVTQVANLGQAGSSGDIPLTAAAIQIVLENGVTVALSLNPSLGQFNTGDFWTFAARTSDGSVEVITNSPPRGVHHHYAFLSVISTFPSTPPSCRVPWPPVAAGATSCGCTLIIQPSDVTASNTLQQILNQFVSLTTETVICLQPGTYNLYAPLQLSSAHSNITLQACQAGTAVLQPASGEETQFTNGMIVMDEVTDFTVSGIEFIIPKVQLATTTFAGMALTSLSPDISAGVQSLVVAIGLRPINCYNLTLSECVFNIRDNYYYGVTVNPGQEIRRDVVSAGAVDVSGLQANAFANPAPPPAAPTLFGACVFAGGSCSGLVMEDNQFLGGGTLAGFLSAPSVSFGLPPPPAPPPSTNLNLIAKSKAPARTLKSKAAKAEPKISMAVIEKGPATDLLPIVDKIPIAASGLAGAGVNQQIFEAPNNIPNYSATGGLVLPSSINGAVIKGNSFGGMTIAVLIVGDAAAVEFTDNEVATSAGGFWLVAPSMASTLAMDPQALTAIGLTIAMGYPLPVTDSGPVTVPAAPSAFRVYTGKASFQDKSGNTWLPDVSAPGLTISGGNLSQPVPGHSILNPLPDASDLPLYQNERWGAFTYTFAVPANGFYQVTLKFAEIFFPNSGSRVFNVSINGTPVLANFDIRADANGEFNADDKVFPNVVPVNGQIVIGFATGTANFAKISAVQVEPQWDGLIPNPYFREISWGDSTFYTSELQKFFAQMTQLAQQAYVSLRLQPLRLRLEENEMTGITSVGLLVIWDDQLQNTNIGSVMMSGNRVDTTNFMSTYGPLSYTGACWYFFGAATAALVSRCVVSGNMLLNEGQQVYDNESDFQLGRVALIVDTNGYTQDYSATDQAYVPAPVTQVAAVGNVFQGSIWLYPQPVSQPPQLNSSIN